MGYSLSWVAVRGKPSDRVLSELGWHKTGEHEAFPESPTTCAELPDDWFCVIMTNRADALEENVNARLSAGAEVIACMVEEHVMFSTAVGWREGAKVWAVEHDAERGIRDLAVTGEPPGQLTEVLNRAKAAQDAADEGESKVDFFFDVPVDIAELVTGYRHDQERIGQTALEFDVLAELPSAPRKGWLRSILQRGAG